MTEKQPHSIDLMLEKINEDKKEIEQKGFVSCKKETELFWEEIKSIESFMEKAYKNSKEGGESLLILKRKFNLLTEIRNQLLDKKSARDVIVELLEKEMRGKSGVLLEWMIEFKKTIDGTVFDLSDYEA